MFEVEGANVTDSAPRSGSSEARTGPIAASPPYRAVIFDLDGVVIDTAAIHAAVRVFPGTEALLRRLRAGGVPVGLVTASRDADQLLHIVQIADLFDVVVDGTTAPTVVLPGEADTARFLEAARRLDVVPADAAVVEDAVIGVRAAREGGFGLVVGIDRGGNRRALEEAGADFVVDDVSQLDLGLRADPWILTYEGFDPSHEGHREALTTLANGYLGTRGAVPERSADDVHYPGTYLAGVYNRLTSIVQGRTVEDEHMVNIPNWLLLDIRIGDGAWWSAGGLVAAGQRTELDMRTGVLTRKATLSGSGGRRLEVTQRRLVSMDRAHVAALETTLVADGWDGDVTVRSGIDAGVTNSNVAEDRELSNRHLTDITAEHAEDGVLLVLSRTMQSRIGIAVAARTTVTGIPTGPCRFVELGEHAFAHEVTSALRRGEPTVVDKTVAIVTSRDDASSSPGQGALDELARASGGLAGLLDDHVAAWARLWTIFRVDVETSRRQHTMVLNLHLFHLLQTLTTHTAALDAGVGARGLHGEGYRGHVFWDELFVMPLLTTHLPEIARSLLAYRWRRLPAARKAAAEQGLAGALFPWQSGSDGREETPDQLFNPRSGRWIPDNSHRQRHVGLAVAHNAWQYFEATGDRKWLSEQGGELIIEVARLFASLSRYDPAEDRFHIEGVMGPDEYHDRYPGATTAGLRDNAYTNVMAAWVCGRAGDVLTLLDGDVCEDLKARLCVRADEPATWAKLSRRLTVQFHGEVISQFDGYGALEELDWNRYRATYGNIGRLDLILEAEGDSTNRYKLAKQADVLMLVYLLGRVRLLEIFEELGYTVTEEVLRRTADYYLARTAHGSTLSHVVHASVLAQLDPDQAWDVFGEALVADLDDTQGGTTSKGIHLGAMAGTVDILIRSFAGLHVVDHVLQFDPRPPDALRALGFRVLHRGNWLDVSVAGDRLRLSTHPSLTAEPIRVRVGKKLVTLEGAGEWEFPVSVQ